MYSYTDNTRIYELNFNVFRFQLNIWDVGGQKSLRSYWRNYFESTDGLVWVVDSADKMRLEDCKNELHKLLQEEVCNFTIFMWPKCFRFIKCSQNNFFSETFRCYIISLCEQVWFTRGLKCWRDQASLVIRWNSDSSLANRLV